MTLQKHLLLVCLPTLLAAGCVDPELPANGYWTCPGAAKKCPDGTTCQSGICRPDTKDAAVKDSKAKDKTVMPDKNAKDMGIPPDQKILADKAKPKDQTPPVDLKVSPDKSAITFPCTWAKYPAPAGVAGAELKAVWGAASTNVFAVGDMGNLLRFNGSTWTKETVPATYLNWNFNDVGGINSKIFITSGVNILKWEGAGKLSVAFTDNSSSMISVGAPSMAGLLATGTGGKVYLFKSGSWGKLATNPTITGSVQAVWGNGGVNVWVGAKATIYNLNTSLDPAPVVTSKTFTASPSANLNDIWSMASQVFAVSATPNGKVYHRDGTLKWQTRDPGNTTALWGVWGTASNAIWVTGSEGIWFFDGAKWGKAYSAPGKQAVKAIHGFGAKNVWAVGQGGTILRCK